MQEPFFKLFWCLQQQMNSFKKKRTNREGETNGWVCHQCRRMPHKSVNLAIWLSHNFGCNFVQRCVYVIKSECSSCCCHLHMTLLPLAAYLCFVLFTLLIVTAITYKPLRCLLQRLALTRPVTIVEQSQDTAWRRQAATKWKIDFTAKILAAAETLLGQQLIHVASVVVLLPFFFNLCAALCCLRYVYGWGHCEISFLPP